MSKKMERSAQDLQTPLTSVSRKLLRVAGLTVRAEMALAIPGTKTRTDPNDYYAILGLDRNKPWLHSEIQTAFRDRAKLYHPDGSSPDVDRYVRVQTAWAVLGDEELRLRYDELPDDEHWIDDEFVKQALLKLSKIQPDLLQRVKEGLSASKQVQETHWEPSGYETHVFYYYADEPLPPVAIREEWVEYVKLALWKRGKIGLETHVGSSMTSSHVYKKAWGNVLLFSGSASMSEVQNLIDFV